MLDATNAWSHHVTDVAELAGVNPAIIERARLAAGEAGGYTLKLEQPVYVAVMADAESGALRRTFYQAWTTRASDQAPQGRAVGQLGGDGGHPAGAPRAGAAARFRQLRRLRAGDAHGEDHRRGVCLPRAAAAGEPRRRRNRNCANWKQFAGQALAPWDLSYWSERLQRERYCGLAGGAAAYFALPRVLEGLFDVAQRLFGVRIVERTGVPVWHPDARYFEIHDAAGAHCGSFYLDPCARAEQAQRRLDG